jgi:hypothetical protein
VPPALASQHTLHTSCVLKQTQCDTQQRPQRERKLNEQGVARDGSYSATYGSITWPPLVSDS